MATGEGTVITDGKGNYKIFKGGSWLPYSGTAGRGASAGSAKVDKTSEQFLNDLSTKAAEAAETERVYDAARQSVKRLRPGPFRGAFLDSALPTENGGVLDKIGAVLIGGPARLLGAITSQDVNDFQRLKGLQSQQVLQAQLAQKGVQSESDAARMQLTDISPSKTAAVNNQVIDSGIAKTQRQRAKAIFYTKFANKWGLNGTTPHGYTADQLWASQGNRYTEHLFPSASSSNNGPEIKVLSRTKVR